MKIIDHGLLSFIGSDGKEHLVAGANVSIDLGEGSSGKIPLPSFIEAQSVTMTGTAHITPEGRALLDSLEEHGDN